MKKYVLSVVMLLCLLSTNTSAAQSNSEPTVEKAPKLELKTIPSPENTSSYLPIWIVDEELKHKMQKFIWVPSKEGHILVLEASNSAILRLAWNLDTYEHGPKTKAN